MMKFKRLGFVLAAVAVLWASPAAAQFYNWSKTAGSNATADASVNWAEGMAPSAVNDSARAMMASVAKWRDDNNGSLTTGGTSTAYTVSTNQSFASLAALDKQTLTLTMSATNGAAPTLNVDGLGAKAIYNSNGAAIGAGTLVSGAPYSFTYYVSLNAFILHNQGGILPNGSVGTASIADAAVTYAKLQNVTASRLLGNPTGSAAAPSEISLGAGLSFSGTSLVSTLDPTSVPGFLSGLELSTAGGSSTFSIAKGGANDLNYGGLLYLSAALSKTTASWSVGSGNGALDQGTIATSTWYHAFLIKRPDTGVVDGCISTSATGCTGGVGNIPAAYTLKRRIGSMKTDGSNQWVKFVQVGDEFLWNVPVQDINGSVISTTASTLTLGSVPTGLIVQALTNLVHTNSGQNAVLISSLDVSDQAPTTTGAAPGVTMRQPNVAIAATMGRFQVRTNTSAQVRARADTGNATLYVITLGWVDQRGR